MSVYKNSRYVKTPAYVRRGETLILSIRNRNNFDLTNATFYTFLQGDTIDGVAYKYYKNPQLWWAIMDCNPKYQSEIEIKAGDILTIPPYDEVVRVSE